MIGSSLTYLNSTFYPHIWVSEFPWSQRIHPKTFEILTPKDHSAVKIRSAPKPTRSASTYDMGVSKNNGTPEWMVRIMENPIKMG